MIAPYVTDITPEWLSAALSGALSEEAGAPVTVTKVSHQRVGAGQLGATFRLDIEYADGVTGPPRLIAKLATEDSARRGGQASFGYRSEVLFYQQLQSTVAVRAPQCSFAAISDDNADFTLLLEDLDPAVPGVQADGCSAERALLTVRNLVGLHAPRWNSPELAELGVMDWTTTADFITPVQVDAVDKFIGYLGDLLPAEDAATLRAAAQGTREFILTRTEPFTLLHGDYRLDNLMFHPNGTEVIALDWQTICKGPALRDVAYFLGTCLEPGLRRAHEEVLVRAYYTDLVAAGVADYGWEQCWADYRLGQLWAVPIMSFGAMNAPEEKVPGTDLMFLAMATRACAAIRDLDSFAAVDR